MPERDLPQHAWVMLRAWPLDDERAAKAVASGAPFREDGPGEMVGPVCGTCHQGYVADGLPCPGRVWRQDDEPARRGLDAMPRDDRRAKIREQRKQQKRLRKGCAHAERTERWVPTSAGPVKRTECADCGTPLISTSIPRAPSGPPLHSASRR